MYIFVDGPLPIQCTNANGYHVASYTLKLSSEPEYEESSGCMLTVEEAYPHLIAGKLFSDNVESVQYKLISLSCLIRNARICDNYEAHCGT